MFRLIQLHQRIDEALRLALRRPAPDSLELTRLKKMKLRVKDLIHRLSSPSATPLPRPARA